MIGGSAIAPHLVDWYTDIYTNVYGVDTTYTDIILKFNEYLKRMVNESAWLDAFSSVVLTIGIGLLLYHFFADMAEKAAANQLSILQTGKSVGMAILAVFVLFHTKQIFIFMMNFVESLNQELTDASSGYANINAFLSSEVVQTLLSRCVAKHFGIFSIIGYTLTALLLMLVSYAVKIYITYYSATRIIQLFVYYVFAPIGLSDIFESGPGGTINRNSTGFRYLKVMFAIMLQLVVVTVTCQTYSIITGRIQTEYFIDEGEDFIGPVSHQVAAEYPLRKFQYTNHKGSFWETAKEKYNDVKSFLNALSGDASEEDTEESEQEDLDNDEIYNVTDVIMITGHVTDEAQVQKIMDDTKYRMTVQSTELFFDWCVGADGGKMLLFIILLLTKVLMVASSGKLCNVLVGVNT